MAALTWDNTGEKIYECGVDRGVLFVMSGTTYGKGVAWNGLTTVSESPSGAEENASYADNIKYASIFSKEEFGATIEAFQSPVEFDECDGLASLATGVTVSGQSRKPFGFSYRTLIGSDVADAGDEGYIIHLVYGAKASPSEKSRETINESPEPTGFSWEVTTTPINVTGHKPTAHLQINSRLVDSTKLAAFEAILYGSEGTVSYSEVTTSPSDNPVSEGWYELVGGVYVLSSDTEVVTGKTYYEKTEVGGTDARLPLPDEVATLFAAG